MTKLLAAWLVVLVAWTANTFAQQRPPVDGQARMLALLNQLRDGWPKDVVLGAAGESRLRRDAAQLNDRSADTDRFGIHYHLAMLELRLGNHRQALHHYAQSAKAFPKVRKLVGPDVGNRLLFDMGVAWLRLGETENCCSRNRPESCIMPLRGDAIHTQPEGSRKAVRYFQKVLDRTKPETRLHLMAQWLLNLASMTLGEYPQGVPEKYRVPFSGLEARGDFPQFVNVASRLGLDTFSQSGGACADDFDGDGYLDLMVSTYDMKDSVRLFRNNQNGTFTDHSSMAGLNDIYGGFNLVQADYDNDGDVDVFVLRGGWQYKNGRLPNSLLRNHGNGTFTDVTFDAGLARVHYPTQTAAWADYDHDGDVDLYIGNESSRQLKSPSQLFRNNGDATFTDVAEAAGVVNFGFAKAVVWGDYDNDRHMDLFVSNYGGANRLYHNNGDGTFTDIAKTVGTHLPLRSFPAWFWDFDNDGGLDLYVSAFSGGIAAVAAGYLNVALDTELATLYRGDGRGGFNNVAKERNLARPALPMGANFGDLDNDGWLDFYLGTGWWEYYDLMPNLMFRNDGGDKFIDVTMTSGFGHLQKGHAVVFADLDNDGDQDVFEQLGGWFAGDKFYDALFENSGFGNHWLTIQLVGVTTNHSAIGARIRVEVTDGGKRRNVYKHVNSGASFGANPLRQTIGLGRAEKIHTVEVYWPTTGRTEIFMDVPLDRFIKIVEGRGNFEVLKLSSFKFEG